MLTRKATSKDIKQWNRIWNEYKDKLKPNRKSGNEIIEYLMKKYCLEVINDEKLSEVVKSNIMNNKCHLEKLPSGTTPDIKTFYIINTDESKSLYINRPDIYKDMRIFIGIDQVTGFFHIEGSETLWDELYCFRGLDEKDIQNPFLVAEYIKCMDGNI